jgi:hypothetical protein
MRWSDRILVNSVAPFISVFSAEPRSRAPGTRAVTGSQQMSDFSLSVSASAGKKLGSGGKSADIGSQVIKLNDITGNFYVTATACSSRPIRGISTVPLAACISRRTSW